MRVSTLILVLAALVIAVLVIDSCVNRAYAAGFYIDIHADVHRSLGDPPSTVYKIDGQMTRIDTYRPFDANFTANPYGYLAFGYCRDMKILTMPMQFDTHLFHESSLATNKDRGITAFSVGVRIWLFQ